jgi:tetratricopeptide (TPR) repeat protein
MPKLSLAMIVFNESSHLGHCLGSVQGLVDEIIVVDTGSTDGTVALALERGAKISHFPWCDDFSAARNESLKLCSGEWILLLDADEALDSQDFQKIADACSQSEFAAFELTMRNYSLGSAGSLNGEAATRNRSQYAEGRQFAFYTDSKKLRLCKNLPGLAFRGRVHEQIMPFFEEKGLKVGQLDAVIHHYGKTLEIREAFKRHHYLEIAKQDAAENPKDYQRQYALMHQAMTSSEWEIALKASQTCEGMRPGIFDPLISIVGSTASQRLGIHDQALEKLNYYLAHCPGHPFALTARALSHFFTGRIDLARADLEEAIAQKPDFSLPYINLSEYEDAAGNSAKAIQELERGMAVLPEDPMLNNALVKLYLKYNNKDQAIASAWSAIQQCPSGGAGLWHRLVAVQLLQAGEIGRAREVLRLGINSFPGNADLKRLMEMAGGIKNDPSEYI